MQVSENLWQLKEGARGTALTQLTNGPLRFLSPVAARSGSRIFFLGLNQPLGMQVLKTGDGFEPAPSFLADATRLGGLDRQYRAAMARPRGRWIG